MFSHICDGTALGDTGSREDTMTKYLAGVLSVIAVGVLLIAYGLLSPRVSAFGSPADMGPYARPMLASEQSLDPYAARYGSASPYANPYVNPYAQAPAFNYPAAPQAIPVRAFARFAPCKRRRLHRGRLKRASIQTAATGRRRPSSSADRRPVAPASVESSPVRRAR